MRAWVRQRLLLPGFGWGVLAGVLLTLALLLIALRWLSSAAPPPPAPAVGPPEVRVSLSHALLERLIADALAEVQVPLVTLRDPRLSLGDDGRFALQLRGETLLGAQPITLQMRVVPAAVGVGVLTERAELGGLSTGASPLTQRLDAAINAQLARQLAFAQDFAVTGVDSSAGEVVVTARLRTAGEQATP